MMMTAGPLYNQNSPDDDTFVANFVARHDTLDALLRRLRSADADTLGIDHILIGPRGMGKTSLLRRLAIGINRDPELAARFVPLSFREEQYNVLRLSDFWRNCGEALAEWAEATGRQELALRLDAEMLTPAWEGAAAGDRFRAEMLALERRAVLLVDNLDLILDAIRDEDWQLRRYLQEPGGPVMIGAATHALRQSTRSDAAFYEFFQPDYLYPLNADETEACMRQLANGRGEEGARVLDVLDRQPGRLKTLHTLTGGNPRVLALIYRLLETDETGAAMADLEVLLDQVTPYYKARVEEYDTSQQRAIIDAVALHWDPITTAQLARATNIVATTLSGQLDRLRKDNLIEKVETSGSYAGHQMVERFFNIWYLMRHGTRRTKQKMRWLVEFLTSFYSSLELNEIARRAQRKGTAKAWRPDYAVAFQEALSRCGGDRPPTGGEAAIEPMTFDALALEAGEAFRRGDFERALSLFDRLIEKCVPADGKPSVFVPQIMFNRAVILGRMGQPAEEVAEYDRLIALAEPAEHVREKELIARSMLNRSNVIGTLVGRAEQQAMLDELVDRFGEEQDPGVRLQVRFALQNKAVRHDIEGEYAAAIAAVDRIIARDGDDPAEQVSVAQAMLHRASLLEQAGDQDAALAAFAAIVARYGASEDPQVAEQVARALFGHGLLLLRQARWELALDIFGQMTSRLDGLTGDAFADLRAGALSHRAIAFSKLQDRAAALASFDAAIALFEARTDDGGRQRLGAVLYNKALLLLGEGDGSAAHPVLEDLAARFGDAEDLALQEIVARAILDLARLAERRLDPDAEEAFYDQLISRFGDSAAAILRQHVIHAMVNKAIVLDLGADKAPVVALYDAVIARFGEETAFVFRDSVATAMLNRAIAIGEMGRYQDAAVAFDALVDRFADAPEASLRRDAANGLVNKAVAAFLIGRRETEIATYREVFDRFGDDRDPALDEPLVQAAAYLAMSLEEIGDFPAVVQLYEWILARAEGRDDAGLLAKVASIRLPLANILADFGIDPARAGELYDAIAEADPVAGHSNQAWLLLSQGKTDEAAAIVDHLAELPKTGAALLRAGIELARGNFGLAVDWARPALDGSAVEGRFNFSDDHVRLLRLAHRTGFGERTLAWFEESGLAERLAPLHVAFAALVRGGETLHDVAPEIAEPAAIIFDKLAQRYRSIADRERDPSSRRTGPTSGRRS